MKTRAPNIVERVNALLEAERILDAREVAEQFALDTQRAARELRVIAERMRPSRG